VFISAASLVNIIGNVTIITADSTPSSNAFSTLINSAWNEQYGSCTQTPMNSYSVLIQSNGTIVIKETNITAP
jgi:hypothetical protein